MVDQHKIQNNSDNNISDNKAVEYNKIVVLNE